MLEHILGFVLVPPHYQVDGVLSKEPRLHEVLLLCEPRALVAILVYHQDIELLGVDILQYELVFIDQLVELVVCNVAHPIQGHPDIVLHDHDRLDLDVGVIRDLSEVVDLSQTLNPTSVTSLLWWRMSSTEIDSSSDVWSSWFPFIANIGNPILKLH